MIKLEKEESIVIVARKHWFILFAQAFFLVFLFLAPFGVLYAYEEFNLSQFLTPHSDYSYLFLALTLAWFLLLWIIFFVMWTNYYLDCLVLTNRRLMDIEQKALFSRTVSTLRLEKIQDVSTDVSGIVATFLDFGDIKIQTAGQEKDFLVKGIAHPYVVKNKILEEQARYRATHIDASL